MKFSPYSFSKMGTFYQCPYKFKLQYIDKIKIPFETNIALEKGKYLHYLIENDMKNENPKDFNFELSLEKDIENYKKIIQNLKISPYYNFFKSIKEKYIEKGFSLKINRTKGNKIFPGDYDDSPDTIVRGYIDFLGIKNDINQKTAIIVDWKSGKYKEDQNEMQIIIYSIWAFLNFSDIEKVETYFYFIEHNKFISRTFYRSQLNELIKKLIVYILPIEHNKKFDKNVTALCDYCPFKKFGHCDGEENLEIFKIGNKNELSKSD